jgi:hypothetical protein
VPLTLNRPSLSLSPHVDVVIFTTYQGPGASREVNMPEFGQHPVLYRGCVLPGRGGPGLKTAELSAGHVRTVWPAGHQRGNDQEDRRS